MWSLSHPWLLPVVGLLGLGGLVGFLVLQRDLQQRLAGLVGLVKEKFGEHDHAYGRLEGRVTDLAGRLAKSTARRRELYRQNQALRTGTEARSLERTPTRTPNAAESAELNRIMEQQHEITARLQEQTTKLEENARTIARLEVELAAKTERLQATEHLHEESEKALRKELLEVQARAKKQHEAHRASMVRATELETSLSVRTQEVEELKAEISRHRRDLEASEKRLERRDQEMSDLRQRRDEVEAASAARVRDLESLLETRDVQLGERQTTIETLRNEMAERNRQLDEALRRCREVEDQARHGAVREGELEQRLRELESLHADRTNELQRLVAERDATLQERSQALEDLRTESARLDHDLESTQGRLAQRDKELEVMRRHSEELETAWKARVAELESHVEAQENELCERQAIVEGLRNETDVWSREAEAAERRSTELEERLRESATRETELARRFHESEHAAGEEIESLRHRIEELDQEVEARDRQIARKDDELGTRDLEIARIDEELRARDQELGRKDEELRTAEERHGELEGTVRELREALQGQMRAAEEAEARADDRIRELQAFLQVRDRELDRLLEACAEANGRCNELTRQAEERERELVARGREVRDLEHRVEELDLAVEQSRSEADGSQAEIDRLVEGRILALCRRRGGDRGDGLPTGYLDGLAQGDLELALQGLLGGEEPLPATSVTRLTRRWRDEYEAWRSMPIDRQVVYLWGDGLHLKAGLEESSALLVLVAAYVDGSKSVLAVEAGDPASKEDWLRILRDLAARGMTMPHLVVAKETLGLADAVGEMAWDCAIQYCWNHRSAVVLEALPKAKHARARKDLRAITGAATRVAAKARRDEFVKRCGKRLAEAGQRLSSRWKRMTSFYAFPEDHWAHVRTTNVVETPLAALRLGTTAPKGTIRSLNAEPIAWKLMSVAERAFRKINAPDLLATVVDPDGSGEEHSADAEHTEAA